MPLELQQYQQKMKDLSISSTKKINKLVKTFLIHTLHKKFAEEFAEK